MTMEKKFSIEELGERLMRAYCEHQADLDRYLGWFRDNEPAAYRRVYEIWADEYGMLSRDAK